MFGGDCYPVELTWQQVPVMSCPRTRFPTRVPRSNSAPWTPHHQQRFVNMRPARYRQACCSTMLHCLLPLLLPFQYITGYVCVFTCPELNLKLFWSFIQSKPRILESFSQCDPITFDHVTDSLLRISPNSWTALRTVWGRDVVLKITMPLKRWRGIPSHSHPKNVLRLCCLNIAACSNGFVSHTGEARIWQRLLLGTCLQDPFDQRIYNAASQIFWANESWPTSLIDCRGVHMNRSTRSRPRWSFFETWPSTSHAKMNSRAGQQSIAELLLFVSAYLCCVLHRSIALLLLH